MAIIDWPSAPVLNQIYQFDTFFWIWTGNAWRSLPNSGQVGVAWIRVGPWIFDTEEFDIGWETENYTWGVVDYV